VLETSDAVRSWSTSWVPPRRCACFSEATSSSCRRESAGPAAPDQAFISSNAGSVGCARRPLERARDHAGARVLSSGNSPSCFQGADSADARRRSPLRPIRAARMNILFIATSSAPGREFVRKALADWSPTTRGLVIANAENSARIRITKHRRRALGWRGRDDVRQSHLGQTEALDYIAKERGCCAPQTIRRRTRSDRTWRRRATDVPSACQRHGTCLHAEHRRPFAGVLRESRPYATGRESSSWTSCERRARRSPWAGTSTARPAGRRHAHARADR